MLIPIDFQLQFYDFWPQIRLTFFAVSQKQKNVSKSTSVDSKHFRFRGVQSGGSWVRPLCFWALHMCEQVAASWM